MRPDKKFLRIQRKHERGSLRTDYPYRGMHLVQRIDGNKRRHVHPVRNAVCQAPFLQASPMVNGVRMRWEKGKLIPR